jgi:glycosyltransferase involved in cell wall biosynthesis
MHPKNPRYSVIIPVYNRNLELQELLKSLCLQDQKDFEVIVVDDGSSSRADVVVDEFRDKLDISYYFKKNSGPGPSRNYGFNKAKGDYLVIFDSDCEIPSHYFTAVDATIEKEQADLWGGPDKAKSNYTALQKAISYAMTSVLTTGGIRGGANAHRNFQPRSFNMGIRKAAYLQSGGFKLKRLSEDIELSIRYKQLGYKVVLVEDAYVYHKRRSTLSQFFKQVFHFGKGRASLVYLYRDALKPAHLFPLTFLLIFLFSCIAQFPLDLIIRMAYLIYFLLIFIDASQKNKSLYVGILSVLTSATQFIGYGLGFLRGLFLHPREL